MANAINWFEIPCTDINRAAAFYRKVMQVELPISTDMGYPMAFFPAEQGKVSGALTQSDYNAPSDKGVLIYLNCGQDLQPFLDRAIAEGAEVFMPKTKITDEIGYFAVFKDSEGNSMAFHSQK